MAPAAFLVERTDLPPVEIIYHDIIAGGHHKTITFNDAKGLGSVKHQQVLVKVAHRLRLYFRYRAHGWPFAGYRKKRCACGQDDCGRCRDNCFFHKRLI